MALLKIVAMGKLVVGWKEMKIKNVILSYNNTYIRVIINFKRAHNVQDAVNIYSQLFVQTDTSLLFLHF